MKNEILSRPFKGQLQVVLLVFVLTMICCAFVGLRGTYSEGALLINRQMAYKTVAIDSSAKELNSFSVVGTVDNYYHEGVFSKPKPAVFEYSPEQFDALLVQTAPGTVRSEVENDLRNLIKKEKLNLDIKVSSLEDNYLPGRRAIRIC